MHSHYSDEDYHSDAVLRLLFKASKQIKILNRFFFNLFMCIVTFMVFKDYTEICK